MSESAVLRSTISDMLRRDAGRAILAPGALVALRLLFHHMGFSSVLLSDREYYAEHHFPGLEVHVAPFDELEAATRRISPDAVVASLVSWRGRVGDVEQLCAGLGPGSSDGASPVRSSRAGPPDAPGPGPRRPYRPMVCVDWCHAGAVGFPSAADLRADVVFGDASKWLIPASTPDRIAFLLGREEWAPTLRACFGGLYRSGGDRTERESRWIHRAILETVANQVRGAAADRRDLRARHVENMELARAVAEANDHPTPETAILWFPGTVPADLDLGALPSPDLAWETGAGVRVLCQASP